MTCTTPSIGSGSILPPVFSVTPCWVLRAKPRPGQALSELEAGLNPAGQRGFNASVNLHLSRTYPLPATGGAPPPVLPPAGQAGNPPTTSSSCGPTGGTATVFISDPKLKSLNVRASPGGTVLGTIPAGSQVSIVGECGSGQAAGIARPQPSTPASGWCQIDAPVTGCVSAKFLAFGTSAAPAAGLAKPPGAQMAVPVAALSFAGGWVSAVNGVAHSITLNQKGGSVTGAYSSADGSVGKISGKISGKVLRFAWSQTDGVAGAGKFILSGDGQSFEGSYTFTNNPDNVEGSWNGSRQ